VPSNLKFCSFRKKLLEYCRKVYEQIFVQDDFETSKKKAEEAGKTYTKDDFKEEQMLRQHKLFGNIEFIGELFMVHLLRSDTAKSIFDNLLNQDCLIDDTVEAAIRFIEKIGPTIEDKYKSDKSKNRISEEEYMNILEKFRTIWKTSE